MGVLAQVSDVTKPVAVDELIEKATEKFGQLDIMVNNAGITRDTLILSMTDEQWDAVMNVNLRAVFLGTRAAAKVMLRRRDRSDHQHGEFLGALWQRRAGQLRRQQSRRDRIDQVGCERVSQAWCDLQRHRAGFHTNRDDRGPCLKRSRTTSN